MDLTEAYVAVYDDDLRSEIEYEAALTEDDLSFIDDYSDNELTQIMEEIFDENLIDIDECFETLDLVISEAVVTSSENRPTSSGSRRVTIGAQDRRMAATTAARTRKVRIGRMAQAAQTAAETKAKQGVSAFGRAASAAGRGIRSGASAVGQKLQAGKQKITNFLGKVSRVAKAAKETAKKEFSGDAERQAKLRSSFRANVRSARQNARAAAAKDTSEFDRPKKPYKPSDPWEGSATTSKPRPTVTTKSTRALSGSSPRAALPAAGQTSAGQPSRRSAAAARSASAAAGSTTKGIRFAGPGGRVAGGDKLPLRSGSTSSKSASRQREAGKFAKSAGISEELLRYILEDLVYQGYAENIDESFKILESLYDDEFENLVESYLDTDVETYDFYDTVMDYLLDEGFADTEEDAEVIMANMSDEWRDDIIETAVNTYTGKPIHADPNDPEEVAKRKRREARKAKTGQSGLTYDDKSARSRRPSRWG